MACSCAYHLFNTCDGAGFRGIPPFFCDKISTSNRRRPPPPHPLCTSTALSKHRHPVQPSFFWFFLTRVFMVRNLAERDCVPIVKGNGACVMFVMSPRNNITLGFQP